MSNSLGYVTKTELYNLLPELTDEIFNRFCQVNKIDSPTDSKEQFFDFNRFRKFYERFLFVKNLRTLQAKVSIKASEYETSLEGKSKTVPVIVDKILNNYITYYKANPEERKNLKENISQYCISDEYKSFYFKLNPHEIESKLLSEGAIKKFFLEKYDLKKSYNANKRLDFYSIFIGFHGWVDAVSKNFTLPVTQDSFSYDKLSNQIGRSLKILKFVELKISDLTTSQNLNNKTAVEEIAILFSELQRQSKKIAQLKSAISQSTTETVNDLFQKNISTMEQKLTDTTLAINEFQYKIENSTHSIIKNQNNIGYNLKKASKKNFRAIKAVGVLTGIILFILLINTFIPKSVPTLDSLFEDKFTGFKSNDSTTFKLLVMPFNLDRLANEASKPKLEYQFLRRFNKIRKRDSLNIEIGFLKTKHPPSDEYDVTPVLNKYNPNMIIWGNYEESLIDDTKIAINYFVSSKVSKHLGVPMNNQAVLMPINSMESIRNGELQGEIDNIIFWIIANYHLQKREFNKSMQALNNMRVEKNMSYNYALLRYLLAKQAKQKEESKKFFNLAFKLIKNKSFKKLDQKYIELGTILMMEGDMVNSLRNFEKALTINPKNEYIFNCTGMILTHYKQYDLAEKAFLKSIEINEKNSLTWYLLGMTYIYLKKDKEVGIAFNMAAGLNPKFYSFIKKYMKDKNIPITDAIEVFQ
jgi:tetratricopeptide (TPR) repeat protein